MNRKSALGGRAGWTGRRFTRNNGTVSNTSTCYEEVAQILLDRLAEDFGLRSVEGKQDMPGNLTGTSWEIDAKGILEGPDAVLIVECRRYTTSKLAQEDVAAIAIASSISARLGRSR